MVFGDRGEESLFLPFGEGRGRRGCRGNTPGNNNADKRENGAILDCHHLFFHQPRLVDGINQATVWLWLALPAPTIFSFDSSWIRSAKEIISE